ncbi:diguanylate cyclase [Sulfurimonas sp. HSL3-2]|uniref:GGDEF domain-containing protein n=1 Tax=Hydrocurvibacter mobilis TaxID=3131936 RepID=UPI0031F82148
MNALYLIGEWLENRVDKIVDAWLSDKDIKELFLKYNIDIKKFSTKFAQAILLHNIGVMQETKQPDDCPIMNKFVDLMLEKNIISEDIFTICTRLRTTILKKLWEEYPDFFTDIASIQKIISIFDRNLSGVLANFDRKNMANRAQKQKEQELKLYLERLQTVFDVQDNIILKIHEGKLHLANKALFLTTGVNDIRSYCDKYSAPLGFIKHVNIFSSIFKSGEYGKWIEKVIQENNGECTVELFNHITNKSSLMQMKVAKIDDLNDYIFTFTNITEQQRELKKLKDMLYKDSLTGLANLKRFEEIIEKKLDRLPDNNFKILMLHLRGFKITNETYGKEKGEEILKNVADVLKEHYPKESARIDIDRFAVMSEDMTLSHAETLVKEIDGTIDTSSIDINSAIVLLHEKDTKESMFERGEILLNHVKNNKEKTVYDESVLQEKENERLKEQQKFLELMKQYKENNQHLPVTSYYLEIPIKSDAAILSINDDTISVTLRKISLFSLYRDDHVYIQMPKKPNYKAKVKGIDTKGDKVLLGEFKTVETSPLDRRSIHVKLQEQVDITIKSRKNRIVAELDSLSINSFVIIVDHLYDIEMDTQLNMRVTLVKKELMFRGHVHLIIAVADKFKLIVHLTQSQNIQDELVPFISNRQIEIIKELQKNVL